MDSFTNVLLSGLFSAREEAVSDWLDKATAWDNTAEQSS